MTETDAKGLSGTDWMGLVTIVIEAAILGVSRLYTGSFVELFSESGGAIPWLTKVVISPAYGAVCALTLLLCGSAMWWPSLKHRPSTKRLFLVLGFVFGLGAIALYVIGLYLPIFALGELAGSQ